MAGALSLWRNASSTASKRGAEDAVVGDRVERLFQRLDLGRVDLAVARPGDLVLEKLGVDEPVEPQAQAACEHDADHPERGAAQRVTGPSSRWAFRRCVQKPVSVSSLSASATAIETGAVRHGVGGAERRVVHLAGLGDGVGEPGGFGVVAPHDALQLGEFVDHFGGEVGLADARRLPRPRSARPRPAGAISPASRAIRSIRSACEPSLRVEGHVGELVEPGVEPVAGDGAQIVLPEELGIGEARGQHLAVAGEDRRALVGGLAVGDGDEFLDPARSPGLRTEKNFWCSFIEVCSTSGGSSMNSSAMSPSSTTGHSTRPATSASRPLSSTTSKPSAKAFWVGVMPDRLARARPGRGPRGRA